MTAKIEGLTELRAGFATIKEDMKAVHDLGKGHVAGAADGFPIGAAPVNPHLPEAGSQLVERE